MNPDPNIPSVLREFAIVWSVAGSAASFTEPRVGIVSNASKVAKSNRCASTKTFATMSPPPPGIPNGALWQPAHEFASGAEMRLKLRGNSSALPGSASGAPVPLVLGRPPPS